MTTIKEAVLSTVSKAFDAQTEKGIAKYGQSLDDISVDAYDWNQMAAEEMIDGMQYQQMEIKKLKRMNRILEAENQKLKLELKRK